MCFLWYFMHCYVVTDETWIIEANFKANQKAHYNSECKSKIAKNYTLACYIILI